MRQKFDENFSKQIFLKIEFDISRRTYKIIHKRKNVFVQFFANLIFARNVSIQHS